MSSKMADVPPGKAGSRLDILQRIKEVPDRIKKAPPKKFGKVGAGLVLGGIGFGWLVFPYILSFAVSKMVNLGEGTDVRNIWKKLPQHMDFNIYIFNITNPDEVQNGGVPVLQEVGPYCYEEWKEKVNLVDDVDSDTITYSNMNTWYFLKKKSAPLTGDELVTVPHLPLLSVLLVAENDFPAPMMSVVNAAMPKIYGKLTSVFMTAKVRDLMFDGVLIDCRAKDIIPKTVCVAIKQNSKALVKLGNNRYLFSFFGIRNATAEDVRLTVKKGTRDVFEIGKVVAINGRSENYAFPTGECSKLTGTDATIFPPFRRPDNNSVVAFSADICRAMAATYEQEGEYQGIKGHKYVVSLGDMKRNPGESCFCPSPDKCLDKGAVDLTKCQGAPIIVTLPHFYDSDEKFLKGVVGVKPDKSKHELTFIMEPTSGVPLIARKRVQFNIHLHPVRYVNLTKKLKPTLVPIFWLEENLDLGDQLMYFLQANLLTNLRLVDILKWTLIVLGVATALGGIVVHRMRKEAEKKKNTDSQEDLLPPASPDVLDAGRLSEMSDETFRSSEIAAHLASRVHPEPRPQRMMTGVGIATPQEQRLWGPKLTPVETLKQAAAVASTSAPLEAKSSRSKDTKGSSQSLGKLGLF